MMNIENIFDDICDYILHELDCEEINNFIPDFYCSDFENCSQCRQAIKKWCFSIKN